MRLPITEMPQVLEVIPSDEFFAECYLKQISVAMRREAIKVGIADADAGKLIDLATVKAKWLSRSQSLR
ncbi:hypothetical protein [Pseudomonas sp.]|jgi:predicted transcriptional regulator|uniref:hypothetical protein n=1 Tax=Pseudomonas sp. TaxID=306 RepID=UPI002E33CEE9|nr:hypothetical protein [Pseudomonas sp.]HEX4547525.1 hypothetical protein [Pseudomonas sp.]